MRLIDADALLARMRRDPLFSLVERYGVSGVIEAEPTVDAVEVVRCNDCAIRYDACPRVIRVGGYISFVTEDEDFCSGGKRKGEENA